MTDQDNDPVPEDWMTQKTGRLEELSPKRPHPEDWTTRGLDSSTALEPDSYTVYMLSTADKLGHTEHTL